MQKLFQVKCCPWCFHPGQFRLNCDCATWLAYVSCTYSKCRVNPRCKPRSIRKNQRYNAFDIEMKIRFCVEDWNVMICGTRDHAFYLDIDQIVEDFKAGKLGLKGHRQDEAPHHDKAL